MSHYRVRSHSVRIKLDANEHPYGVASSLRDEVAQALQGIDPARYPDNTARGVRNGLGHYLGLDPDQVVVGSGSNEVMIALMAGFRDVARRIVVPRPTFGMYRVVAKNLGLGVCEVPLDEHFRLSLDALADATTGGGALVFLCMPNNPTGGYFPEHAIETALQAGAEAVVLDEAYVEFASRDHLHYVHGDPRVISLRTLSKGFGLAGARVGYCVAHPDTVERIDRARPPYNVNVYTQVVAEVVLRGFADQLETVDWVCSSRDKLCDLIEGVRGLHPFPSEANFLLFRVDPAAYGSDASSLWNRLEEGGIAIRRFDGVEELADCLRVSVGLPEENAEFVRALHNMGGEQA